MRTRVTRLLPIGIVFTALYLAAICTTAGQAAEETVFMAWRHLQLRGGAGAFRLVEQATALTRLIPVLSLAAVAVVVVATSLRHRSVRPALSAVLAGVCVVVAAEVAKFALPRQELVHSDFGTLGENSLPSGHVAVTAASELVIALLVSTRWRTVVVALGGALVAAAGIAVTAIGWHRPSDSVAAIVLACGAAVTARPVRTGRRALHTRRDRRAALVAACIATGLAIAAGVAAGFCGPVAGGVSGTQPPPPADVLAPAALVAASASALAAVVLWPHSGPGLRARVTAPTAAALAGVVLIGFLSGPDGERDRGVPAPAGTGTSTGPGTLDPEGRPALHLAGSGPMSPWDDVPAIDRLDPALLTAIREAFTDAASAGVRLEVNSGWRSHDEQRALLDQAVADHGTLEAALHWVSTPETSHHTTGNAVDVGPAASVDWLDAHGRRFGLCRTYDNEAWHFELVTTPGAPCPSRRPSAADGR